MEKDKNLTVQAMHDLGLSYISIHNYSVYKKGYEHGLTKLEEAFNAGKNKTCDNFEDYLKTL